MKRAISKLKERLNWLNEYKHSELAKYIGDADSEIIIFEKAIKILKDSERQTTEKPKVKPQKRGITYSYCQCNSNNYGYGFAVCYDCGKIKKL